MRELRTQLSEYFEAHNVMHCNKVLLLLSKSLNIFFSGKRWWLTGCSLFQQIKFIQTRLGFGILDSVLTIRNNSGIVKYSEMPIPSSNNLKPNVYRPIAYDIGQSYQYYSTSLGPFFEFLSRCTSSNIFVLKKRKFKLISLICF